MSSIILENISKTFNKRKVLDIIKSEIVLQGLVAVTGWSGSGKSTLLNILSLLDYPDYNPNASIKYQLPSANYTITFKKTVRGHFQKNYREIRSFFPSHLKEADHAFDTAVKPVISRYDKNSKETKVVKENKFRREILGYIFQEPYLHPNLTVEYNIKSPLLFKAQTIENDKIIGACKNLEIIGNLNQYPNKVSGGESQRISILRAMVKKCPIIFADELTSNIDYEKSQKILKELKTEFSETKKHEDGVLECFLWVSHNINLILDYADTIICIKSGKLEILQDEFEDSLQNEFEDRKTGFSTLLDKMKQSHQELKETENPKRPCLQTLKEQLISIFKKEKQIPPERVEITGLSTVKATPWELFIYYLLYAYKDLFKKFYKPSLDFLYILCTLVFIITFLMSIFKISYGSSVFMERKLSDPRINYLKIKGNVNDFNVKHIDILQNKIGRFTRNMLPIYLVPLSIKEMNQSDESWLSYSAVTFRENDPVVETIFKNENIKQVPENIPYIIVRRGLSKSLGYDTFPDAGARDMFIKFNRYNKDGSKTIKTIYVDSPMPFDKRIMIPEKLFMVYFFEVEQTREEKPSLNCIAVYPQSVHETQKIIDLIKADNRFDISQRYDVDNKLIFINEMKAQAENFILASIVAIFFISFFFIWITVFRNLEKKQKEIGVFMAFGMRKLSFFLFYMIEIFMICLATWFATRLFFSLIEPWLNTLFVNSSLSDVMEIGKFKFNIDPEDLKLPAKWKLNIYLVTYGLFVFIFCGTLIQFIFYKPIDLLRGK